MAPAERVRPAGNCAVRVTGVGALAEVQVMVKVACVAPAGTVTLAGPEAAVGLVLDRLTTAPPAGAGLLRVTVAEALPGATSCGGVPWASMTSACTPRLKAAATETAAKSMGLLTPMYQSPAAGRVTWRSSSLPGRSELA